jgi:hypothetical protein
VNYLQPLPGFGILAQVSDDTTATVKGGMHLVVCLLGCFLLAPPAFAQKVKVDFDKDTDFSHVRGYQWRTHPVFEKRPDLKERYATGIQIVLEAGNAQLMKKGLQPVDVSPDVFVTFFLVAQDEQRLKTVDDFGPWWGTAYGWYGQPVWSHTEVEYYKAGMLVLDIVDARTSKLIWRAYCSDTITDMRNRDKNITSAVKKALKKFPPKHK